MSEIPYAPSVDLEQAEARRRRLFRVVGWICFCGAAAFLAVFGLMGLLVPGSAFRYLLLADALLMLLMLVSLWLDQRGHLSEAIGVMIVGLTLALFVGTYLANGVGGPLAIMLVSLPIMAGLLAGSRAARYVALSVASFYILAAVLEAQGLLHVPTMSVPTARAVRIVVFLAMLGMTSIAVGSFADLAQEAVRTAQRRGQEMMALRQEAQQAAEGEREARQREARGTLRLGDVLRQYTAFLEQVASGEHSARLDVEQVVQGEQDEALGRLGYQLNATVDVLTAALQNMQVVQRRYLAEAWERFAYTGRVRRRLHRWTPVGLPAEDGPEGREEGWLAAAAEVAENKQVAVREDELLLPIVWGSQALGVVRMCRGGAEDGEPTQFSDEDVALSRAIVEQLAQTMENLRLLDETQRSADREYLIGQVTRRMRESLDLETMIQVSASEIRQAMALDRVIVHLATPEQLPQLRAAEAQERSS